MKVDSRQLFQQLISDLLIAEPIGEKESIIYWVMEHQLGLSRAEVLSGKLILPDETRLREIIQRLNRNEPLQYILEEAEFYGRTFSVGPSVLIPRPETEILVQLAIDHFKGCDQNISILDIGTGSGCIAITLALELSHATVTATDVSTAALVTAKTNSERLKAKIQFHQHNILQDELIFGQLDAVVSNPPYIPEHERITLSKNVIDFEPGTALFVPDAVPLVFHSVIATKARKTLKSGGLLITEINEGLGRETYDLYASLGYSDVRVIKDLGGKDRFVSGIWR
jgi:release factor glutamine methyltransferase